MEWTIGEQMRFFGYSICLGGMIGIVLDFFSGWGRNRTRTYCFWLDVAFGPIAAVLLFIGSLVIMDGQLHPLLLLGALFGLALEHVTIGVLVSKTVVLLRGIARKGIVVFGKICIVPYAIWSKMAGVMPQCDRKTRKKMKKEGK